MWIQDLFIEIMYEKRGKLAKSISIYPNMINTVMTTFIQQHLKAFIYKDVLQYDRQNWGSLRMDMSLELLKKFSESIKNDNLQKWKQFN